MSERQKSAELHRLAAEAAAELVGPLYRPLAHELNNPIQAILGGAELLDLALQRPRKLSQRAEELRGLTKQLREESLRMAAIVAQLHALVREDSTPGPCSLQAAWARVHPLWSIAAQRDGLTLEIELEGDTEVEPSLSVVSSLLLGWLEELRSSRPVGLQIRLELDGPYVGFVACCEGSRAQGRCGAASAELRTRSQGRFTREGEQRSLRFALSHSPSVAGA